MIQNYLTEAENEYVIRGNTAVVKCKIPSFVADFVSVDAWIDDSATTYTSFNTNDNCKSSLSGGGDGYQTVIECPDTRVT